MWRNRRGGRATPASAPPAVGGCSVKREPPHGSRPARHRQAELLFARLRAVLADEPAFIDDENPVGKGADLVQLERDEENRFPRVTLLHEPTVDVLDRPDVESAGRLRCDEHTRVGGDLACDDNLLLIAA